MEWYIALITFLYGLQGVIGVIAYAPTIKDLRKRIPSANHYSYGLWTLSYGLALLYAAIVIADLLLSIVIGLHFISCGLIAFFTWKLKKSLQK